MNINRLIPNFLKPRLSCLYPLYQKFVVWKVRHKKTINVVFFAMTLPMWRYQHLYDIMKHNKRFRLYVVIQPTSAYASNQRLKDIADLANYFTNLNIPFLHGTDKDGVVLDVRKKLKPDILFYTQPYTGDYPKILSSNYFYDKLLCYYPYAFWAAKDDWSYNLPFHRYAWKLFYSTQLHKLDSIQYSRRKDKNVEVVGYPSADDFLYSPKTDVWKEQRSPKKRIIWAPHFTLFEGGPLYQSNFLWMADLMLELAKKYSDRIQCAFKPHPRLYTELCKHKDWGEHRAKSYYLAWETMENTQIETGEFVNLFMTSDAMIHDCGSFSIEYHYTENPVMYVAQNFEEQLEEKNEFGKLAMKQHYVGKTKEDIIAFVEDVVLAGDDPMKLGRIQFKKDYLLPPNGKTVAENTMDVFLKAFC